jgi:hypothetical protein
MKLSTFVLWVSTLVSFILILFYILSSKVEKDYSQDIYFIRKSMDSLAAIESNLYHKIDSIQRIKTKLVTKYETTTLYYDTLRVTIDSMPDADALYFLLAKSRQLTRKGVE